VPQITDVFLKFLSFGQEHAQSQIIYTIHSTDYIYTDWKVNVIWRPTKNVLPSNLDISPATMRALCQTRALTPAMNAAVDPSIKKLTTNLLL
jgi:hypothetical protein